MKELIEEAIEFIKEHEPPEGYFVGFSGGKDSIVTYDLVKRSGVKHQAYYSATYIDPPEVTRFIKKNYPEIVWLKPDMTFWEGCKKNGMPTHFRRWCCRVLKHDTKSNRTIPLKNKIMGVRAKESVMRSKLPKMGKWRNKETIFRPIFTWDESDIWEYIKQTKMDYCSLYDIGFKRLGCIVCPMDTSKDSIARKRKTWPSTYNILDKYLNLLWEQNKEILERHLFTEREFKSWPLWKTKQERKQINLFKEKQ